MVVWKLRMLYSFQNGWFAGSILLFGSAPSRQRTCQTLRKDKSSPQKYFGQGDMLVPRFLSWQTKGHEMWWDSDVPCCCFCLCVHIYIYMIHIVCWYLRSLVGFHMVWKLDLHTLNFRRKTEGLCPKKGSPLKTMVGICLGNPPRVSLQTGWETVGPTKIPGKTHGDFRGKIPGPNVALERWRPYKRPKMGPQVRRCFGLKPTEASPLETNQVLPPETKTRPTGPQKSKFKSKRTSNFRVSTVSFRGYELCNWAVIKKIFGG